MHGDDEPQTAAQRQYRWYEPGKPCSPKANQVNGIPIAHELAKLLYEEDYYEKVRRGEIEGVVAVSPGKMGDSVL
jgi:hypothetical protein